MKWSVLTSAILLVGCHDFDSLVRGGAVDLGTSDLVTLDALLEDATSGDDLTGAVDLQAAIDLHVVVDLSVESDLTSATPEDLTRPEDLTSPSDLTPCVVGSLPLHRVYVNAAAQSGGDGARLTPFQTIAEGVAAAKAANNGSVVFIAAGDYQGSIEIDSTVGLWGGWEVDFACPTTRATNLRSVVSNHAAVTVTDAADVLLRGVVLIGKSELAGTDRSIALEVDGSGVVLDGVTLQSQAVLTDGTRRAHALVARQSTVEIYRSTLLAGNAALGATVVDTCSTNLVVTGSRIEHASTLSVLGEGIRQSADCGIGVSALLLERCVVVADGSALGLAIYAPHSIDLKGVAIWAQGPMSSAIFSGNGVTSTVSIVGSTLVSQGGPAYELEGSTAIELEDSIVAGTPPFLAGSLPNLALTPTGMSVVYGYGGPTAQDQNLSVNATMFQSTYDNDFATKPNLAFYDPVLVDYHLGSTTTVRDQAVCHLSLDIDGEDRPQSTSGACDIGADEVP